MITLDSVFRNPLSAAYDLELNNGLSAKLQPLVLEDVEMLGQFLADLSPVTRDFSTFDSYDITMAKELCNAINKYDKLRLVIELQEEIVGLLEFSFSIPERDQKRFAEGGYKLSEDTDCRFGITLADKYQDLGLGSKLIPVIKDVAKKFGKERVILWGGVFESNKRALHYYEKNGFKEVCKSLDGDGKSRVDMVLNL